MKKRLSTFHGGGGFDYGKFPFLTCYSSLSERYHEGLSWVISGSCQYSITKRISLSLGMRHGKQMSHYLNQNFTSLAVNERS